MPFDDGKFDFVISHGVLDSMPLETAKASFGEVHRVLAEKGLFYCSLICADGIRVPPEFCGETLVEQQHEKGTIQLYYNWTLINEMIAGKFNILECKLTTEQYFVHPVIWKRYSVIMEKK